MSVGLCVLSLCTVRQSVSQRTPMPFVVCCGCGETRDKRLTVGFYHLVYVRVAIYHDDDLFTQSRHEDLTHSMGTKKLEVPVWFLALAHLARLPARV